MVFKKTGDASMTGKPFEAPKKESDKSGASSKGDKKAPVKK